MKKIALLLAVLMALGGSPAMALVATVDNYVDATTKDNRFEPVRDTGRIYGTVNEGIGKGMDQVPVLKERHVVMNPLDKMLRDTMDGTKMIINGTWDLLTLKSLREKKTE